MYFFGDYRLQLYIIKWSLLGPNPQRAKKEIAYGELMFRKAWDLKHECMYNRNSITF